MYQAVPLLHQPVSPASRKRVARTAGDAVAGGGAGRDKISWTKDASLQNINEHWTQYSRRRKISSMLYTNLIFRIRYRFPPNGKEIARYRAANTTPSFGLVWWSCIYFKSYVLKWDGTNFKLNSISLQHIWMNGHPSKLATKVLAFVVCALAQFMAFMTWARQVSG